MEEIKQEVLTHNIIVMTICYIAVAILYFVLEINYDIKNYTENEITKLVIIVLMLSLFISANLNAYLYIKNLFKKNGWEKMKNIYIFIPFLLIFLQFNTKMKELKLLLMFIEMMSGFLVAPFALAIYLYKKRLKKMIKKI